jgi:hypothetical protein
VELRSAAYHVIILGMIFMARIASANAGESKQNQTSAHNIERH